VVLTLLDKINKVLEEYDQKILKKKEASKWKNWSIE